MSNFEEFSQITKAIEDNPIFISKDKLDNLYIGCIAGYLAQIADALNEIKEKTNEMP